MKTDKQKIQKLKDYFAKREDVVMAFLFGSQARGLSSKISDWDIAVYIKSDNKNIEIEKKKNDFPEASKIWRDLTDILKTDSVDLIILNRTTANIADSAVREGEPLVIKDRKLYLEFLLKVSREAEDYRKTVKEYAAVYWRSASLNEKDAEIINKRLIFLDSELKDMDKFSKLDQFAYERDNTKRREVERLIENLMNAAIDISKTLLASEKRQVPGSYREILRSLYLIPGFSENLGEQLSDWAELRNILAHEYLDIRFQQIRKFIANSQPYFEDFIKKVKEFLKN